MKIMIIVTGTEAPSALESSSVCGIGSVENTSTPRLSRSRDRSRAVVNTCTVDLVE